MLNITSATASAGLTPAVLAAAACAAARVDRVDAAQAATRPLAGTGAGAFTCEGVSMGTLAGFRTSEAAAIVIPRPRWAAAAGAGNGLAGIGLGHASAGFAGRGTKAALVGVKSGTAESGKVSPVNGSTISTQQFDNSKLNNQMTRSYPITPGGVGPHPAREPDPV